MWAEIKLLLNTTKYSSRILFGPWRRVLLQNVAVNFRSGGGGGGRGGGLSAWLLSPE